MGEISNGDSEGSEWDANEKVAVELALMPFFPLNDLLTENKNKKEQ